MDVHCINLASLYNEKKERKKNPDVLSQYLAQRGINIYTLYIEELVL